MERGDPSRCTEAGVITENDLVDGKISFEVNV